jgi:hypothetical protein
MMRRSHGMHGPSGAPAWIHVAHLKTNNRTWVPTERTLKSLVKPRMGRPLASITPDDARCWSSTPGRGASASKCGARGLGEEGVSDFFALHAALARQHAPEASSSPDEQLGHASRNPVSLGTT